jgi:tetratricopeptide (TPR) repeat protein
MLESVSTVMWLRRIHRDRSFVLLLVAFLIFPMVFGLFARGADFAEVSKQAGEARDAGRLTEAVKLYREALSLEPDWLEGLWYLGTILYDSDRHTEARDAFEHFVELSPDNGPAWAFLGLCYFHTAQYDLALSSLKKARKLGIDQQAQLASVVRFHMALLLNHAGKYEEAFEALREFALTNLRSPSIIEAFGLSALRKNWLPADVPPESRELVLKVGEAAYETAAYRFKPAESLFEKVIKQYPDEPNVHYAFGVALAEMRGLQGLSKEDAMKQFEAELEVSPNHVPALLQLALGYIDQGRFEEAQPYAERAIQVDPSSFIAYYALGQIRMERGNLDQAVDALKRAAELSPASPEVHFTLARAYQKAGRKDDAARERAEFDRLSKLKKESIEILQ